MGQSSPSHGGHMLSKVKHCSCFLLAGYVLASDELLISRLLQDSDGSQVQMTGDESLSQALRTRAIADTAVSPQAILDKFFFMMLLLISPIHFP
jgi:hypothetical protein